MSFSKFAFAVIAASLMTSAAIAQTTPAAAPPAMGDHGGHGMMHGMLSPEERMMLMADMHKATASMTDDQKHAYREQQRDRIMGMSDTDRAKFKADLDTRWAALPADQKAMIKAAMDARMAAHSGGAAPQ
jgi:Spy/CpxP family protein refolding chaperone